MPIVVVKSGRSAAGERATSSHTGALLAASDVTRRRALRAGGGDPHRQPRGDARRRLAAREPAAAGRAAGSGSSPTRAARGSCARTPARRRASRSPSYAETGAGLAAASSCPRRPRLRNPVDMIATATAEQYRGTIATLAGWDGHRRPDRDLHPSPADPRRGRRRGGPRGGRADAARDPGAGGVHVGRGPRGDGAGGGVPTYLYPEDARAGARPGDAPRRVAGRVRRREPPDFDDVRGAEAGGRDRPGARVGRGVAATAEAIDELLDCYGIAIPAWRVAADPAAPAEAAEELGGTGRSQGAGRRACSTRASSARSGSGSPGARRSRARPRRWTRRWLAPVCSARVASSSRRWSRAGSSCWSAWSTTRSSARWSPAEPAARRPSCSRTSPCGSARSPRRGRGRDAPLPGAFPLLTGLPRRAERADLGAVEELLLRVERDGRGPSRDRRARPQSGGGGPGGSARRGRPDPGAASPPARPWPSAWKLGDP